MPERKRERNDGAGTRPRPFWSGTIAFGLVSLPVSLYVATRGKSTSLRLVDESGTPLKRQYFCPLEEKPLANEEVVRGFEVEKDEFVVVSDEELDAIAPEKSQEIDLRRFVSLAEIDPVYFERAYFLLPEKGAGKAYRLLAQAMESGGRAGIATFVMRGKEYLVAIIAEGGVLRAETLRFADELRSPEDVGLPERKQASDELVDQFEAELSGLTRERLDRSWLVDREGQRLRDLVARKLESGADVIAAPEEAEPEEEGNEVVDLMRLLKESLEEVEETEEGERRRPAGRSRREPDRKRAGANESRAAGESGGGEGESLDDRSKSDLYERARELDIPGRSNMSKAELVEALRSAR